MRNRQDKKSKPIRVPKGSRRSYDETLGKLLAQEKINEVKAAQYGRLSTVDRYSNITRLPAKEGYTTKDRPSVYRKALQLYDQNELVRPIINLISTAIFSHGQPDIRGKNEKLTEFIEAVIQENDVNFHQLAIEGELAGDVFLAFDKANKEKTEILSLDAGRTISLLKDNDIRQLQGYALTQSDSINSITTANSVDVGIPVNRCQHFKFNSTTTSQYGRSSLRHVIYWLDVLDSLFESKWLRGADNYGQPLLAITGVPTQFQAAFKTSLESEVQRAGKTWVLPPDTAVTSVDQTLNYPIGDIVGWVFRMITIATEIPITMLGSADAASRGSAFFANPRFVLAINPRREVWRIGLRRFFIKLAQANGIVGDDEIVGRDQFDIGFFPVFERDLTDIADVVAIYRNAGMISKETAQEWVGIDASEEREKLEQEQDDINNNPNNPDNVNNPNNPNNPQLLKLKMKQDLKNKTKKATSDD